MRKLILFFTLGLLTGMATISFLFVIITAVLGGAHMDIKYSEAGALSIIALYTVFLVVAGFVVDYIIHLIWHERK